METEQPQIPNEATGWAPDVERVVRRVVCAAVRVNDHIICSARHYDALMVAQMELIDEAYSGANVEQGFIDQKGEFLTREKAWKVAYASAP